MVNTALDHFVFKYLSLISKNEMKLEVEYDSEWLSPCLTIPSGTSVNDGERIPWVPVQQASVTNQVLTMKNIEHALELEISDELTEFYTRYFSLDLPAKTSRGGLSLLQVWNKYDYERLQGNLIAHVLMKRRLKQSETLFFAVTDEDDFIISLDCASNKVVLEQVGKEPCEVLADSISEFLNLLEPALQVGKL